MEFAVNEEAKCIIEEEEFHLTMHYLHPCRKYQTYYDKWVGGTEHGTG